MADMQAKILSTVLSGTVLAGERVRLQILNSDGTEKTLVYDESVPTGKTLALSGSVGGTLE
jgi:hypothetical protein